MKLKWIWALFAIAVAPLALFGQYDDLTGMGSSLRSASSLEQTLLINSGTFDGRTNAIPIYGQMVGTGLTKTQFIIPKESIDALQYAEITQLKFYSVSVSSGEYWTWGDVVFEMYLTEVDFTEFDSFEYYNWDNMDLVYTGGVEIQSSNMTICLDSHYTYGGGNLMIGFKQATLGTNRQVTWRGVQTSYSTGLFGCDPQVSKTTKLPQMSFVYLPHEAPSCIRPTDMFVEELSATSATVNWTDENGQSAWLLAYSTDASFDPDQTTAIDVVQRPYTFSNLEPETDYYLYIKANCGNNGYSDWSNRFVFTTTETCVTPIDLQLDGEDGISAEVSWTSQLDNHILRYKDNTRIEGEVLLFDDFENGLPSSWTTVDADGDNYSWSHDATGFTSFEGTGCVYSLSYIHSTMTYLNPDNWLITPQVRLGGTVTFYAKGKTAGLAAPTEHFAVYVSTTNTDVDNFSQVSQEFVTTGDYALYSVDLSSYQGEVGYIAIRHFHQSHVFSLSIDNFAVYSDPPVWTEIAGISSSSYLFEGLSEHSFYEAQVKAVCDEDEESRWSKPLYFNTTRNCNNHIVDINHPIYESFESMAFPPSCWAADSNADGRAWSHYVSHHSYQNNHQGFHSGSSSAFSGYNGTIDLTMPVMQIVGNAADLSFWSYNTQDVGTNGSNSVWISTDGGATFTCVWEKAPSVFNFWEQTVVHLNSSYLNKEIIVAFRFVATSGHTWNIDDVEVKVLPDKTFVTAGNWNVSTNWSPQGVPSLSQNVLINAAATIPNGYVAEVNTINIGVNGSLTIADGGQLVHNNTDVEATVKKTVAGYDTVADGWTLLSSPIERSLNPYYVRNLLADEADTYDLYGFNQSASMEEWQNYKAGAFTCLENTRGYLYANAETVDIEFEGEVMPSVTPVSATLEYDPSPEMSGWNLVGNPFPCNAYFEDGTEFFRMNEEGTDFMLADGAINPCEGVFVKVNSYGQSVVFTRTAPSTEEGRMNLNLVGRSGKTLNRARVNFGKTHNTEVFGIRRNSTKLFFSKEGKDFASIGSETSGELPLSFKASENGIYTITVNCDERMCYLHLIDHLTGIDTDLLTSPSYTFESKVTDYASRFKVVFVAGSDDASCIAIVSHGQLMVFNPDGESVLQIMDMMGRLVYSGIAEGNLPVDKFASGVYVLRQLKGSEVKTQKIVIE